MVINLDVIFFLIFGDINPFCGATDTYVLDSW